MTALGFGAGVRRAGLVGLVLLLACRAPDPPADVLADARKELEARGASDQEVRQGIGATVELAQIERMARVDSANSAWLEAYVDRWGWPTAEQVGRDNVQAAFLIVQHAVHDTAFMRAMLPHIQQAYRRGDVDGQPVALLIDRLEVKAGRPQIYGTQLSLVDGRLVLDPIADSAGVDARRRTLGLPPLAEYLRKADSAFKSP